MADVKISALPAASTPLTGAEVLPIVQSSVTTKVAVSNLTAGLAGTATININGTVGATTPAAGAFTTVSASSVASFANGAVGAPGVTFTSDTDCGIFRIGANNLGVAVNGAKVLDVATTGLGVTGRVTYSARALGGYAWNTFNPSDVAGTATNAPSGGTTLDSDFITLVNSSGTLTCTFDIAGTYLITLQSQAAHANTYVNDRAAFGFGGTATRQIVANAQNSGDSVNDMNMAITVSFYVTATAAQTLTVLPTYELTGGGTTASHSCSPIMTITYFGT